jgi:hypothetical protein
VYNTDDTDLLIVAVKQGQLPPLSDRLFSTPAMKAELARVGIASPTDISSRFLGNRNLLLPLVNSSGVPANSDYFPYVDLHAAKARIMKRNAVEFTALETLPIPFFDLLRGATHDRGSTLPSPQGTTARDTMAAEAVALREAIESGRFDDLEPRVAGLILALQSSREACAAPAVRRAWLTAAYHVAAETSAPLSVSEQQRMWDNIAQRPCAAMLDPGDRRMLALLRAVSVRDAAGIAQLGTELFASKYEFAEPVQMQFTVLATAAAEIALNRSDAALQMIADNGGRTTKTAVTALALRWMAAIATAQTAGGQAQYARSEAR